MGLGDWCTECEYIPLQVSQYCSWRESYEHDHEVQGSQNHSQYKSDHDYNSPWVTLLWSRTSWCFSVDSSKSCDFSKNYTLPAENKHKHICWRHVNHGKARTTSSLQFSCPRPITRNNRSSNSESVGSQGISEPTTKSVPPASETQQPPKHFQCFSTQRYPPSN